MIQGVGYFLYPPVWLEASPLEGTAEDLRSTWDPIALAALPSGIRVRCFRNGLFTFDLRGWTPGAPTSGDEADDFETMTERIRWRSALLNAHLACLFTAWKRVDSKTRTPMVVTPAQLITVQEDLGMSVTNAPEIGELLRVDWTSLSEPPSSDWRLERSEIVSRQAVDDSFALLEALLQRPDGQYLTLADLALRSVAAHQAQNFDASLIQSWAITEKLLTSLWEGYLEDNREREVDGRLVTFINRERRDVLTGRDLPISMLSEILSLLDLLPYEMFTRLKPIRQARNNWIHSLKPITGSQSAASADMALDLLRFVHGVDLDPAPDVMIVSGS